MTKRGAAVWVSAILYFGIGIVIITILLTAGLPVINKLKDKNVVIQSKQVMHTLDENIRDVIREGPGSQRVVTVNLKKGELEVDDGNDLVRWTYRNSNVLISEPGIDVREGRLNVRTEEALQGDKYDITITIYYSTVADISTDTGVGNLVGLTDLIVRNEGLNNTNAEFVTVSISRTN